MIQNKVKKRRGARRALGRNVIEKGKLDVAYTMPQNGPDRDTIIKLTDLTDSWQAGENPPLIMLSCTSCLIFTQMDGGRNVSSFLPPSVMALTLIAVATTPLQTAAGSYHRVPLRFRRSC